MSLVDSSIVFMSKDSLVGRVNVSASRWYRSNQAKELAPFITVTGLIGGWSIRILKLVRELTSGLVRKRLKNFVES